MMNKKAGEGLVMNKMIVLILIILVILAVIFGLWRFGIIDKVKDLFPDFNKTASDNGNGDVNPGFDYCPVKVVEIKDNYIYVNGVKTNLFLRGDNIKLNEFFDEYVGVINNNEVNIIEDWFYSEDYKKHPKMPPLYVLRSLDGSYKRANFLCRDKEIVRLKVGDTIDLDNIPKEWKPLYSGINTKITTFSDDYEFKILVHAETGIIQKLMKDSKEIAEVWIEEQ